MVGLPISAITALRGRKEGGREGGRDTYATLADPSTLSSSEGQEDDETNKQIWDEAENVW